MCDIGELFPNRAGADIAAKKQQVWFDGCDLRPDGWKQFAAKSESAVKPEVHLADEALVKQTPRAHGQSIRVDVADESNTHVVSRSNKSEIRTARSPWCESIAIIGVFALVELSCRIVLSAHASAYGGD